MTGNCLFDTSVLKYIHIYTYFVKKRDSYEIFRLSMKISWEPGSQVPVIIPPWSEPWAEYRDFDQAVDSNYVYGFLENLLGLARFLDRGLVLERGSMSRMTVRLGG